MTIDKAPRLEQDPRAKVWATWNGSVLLSDEIKYYSTSSDIPKEQHLIDPFCEEHVEAARYNLRLGNKAHVGGKLVALDDQNPELILEPHQSAVVQVYEKVRLPRFLIARWNLTVRMVYEGLLWTGALQVDPGWHGHLVCPIYNLANRKVHLRYKQELFAIDFVRTTAFDPNVSKPYVQKRGSLEQYDVHRLQSAPYQLIEEVKTLREEVGRTTDRVNTFAVMTVGVLSVIIAAFGLLVAGNSFDFTVSIPAIAAMVLSIVALGIALWNWQTIRDVRSTVRLKR